MSFSLVCRLVRKFSADVVPVISAKNLVDLNPKSVENKYILVKSDTRFTSQLIADMVGFSKASALQFW